MILNKFKAAVKNTIKTQKKMQDSLLLVPSEIERFKAGNTVDFNALTNERAEELISWCFTETQLDDEFFNFCNALLLSCAKKSPRAAYRLYMLLEACGQDDLLAEINLITLEDSVLSDLKIGIAVITYNRLGLLQKNIANITKNSPKSVLLIVADDGSEDGTVQWCAKQKIPFSNVGNTGVVENKNRALYYLHEIEKCDISILLEDDCYPVEEDWEKSWALSALVWGHINYAHKRILSQTEELISGTGETSSPYRSKLVTGQCTATSMYAFQQVGYLNPIFKGYGCGHVEWSERFLQQGYNGGLDNDYAFACINTGLRSIDAPTHKSESDILRNRELKSKIKAEKEYQLPWGEESEQDNFLKGVNSFQKNHQPMFTREKTQLELNENYLFIHISKTAGTSFRLALEKKYTVWSDYGNKEKDTNTNVQKYIYEQHQPLLLKNKFTTDNNSWLIGHIPLNKYCDFVSARHVISFVRNPAEQVVSHFNHFVSHHKYKGTLEEFIERTTMRNFQSKYLNFLPVTLVGFVGLTEEYDNSLNLLNSSLGVKIDSLKVNVNNNKTHKHNELSEELIERILDVNKRDKKLYQEAASLFKQRKKLFAQGLEWTYSHFDINARNVLVGCAYYSHSSEPVELQILRNGVKIKTLLAKDFYGGFTKANFPRERYIGIHFPLGKEVTKHDKFEVVVTKTKQNLTLTPLKIK